MNARVNGLDHSTALVPVTAAPALDPGHRRVRFSVKEGATIAAIVERALPGASDFLLARVRVSLVSGFEAAPVPRRLWHLVRPKEGIHVVIRIVPGKGFARALLAIVVAVAASFLAPYLAPVFTALGFSAATANALATTALTIAGGLLINALIPPADGGGNKEKPTFAISGWRNPFVPDGTVPAVLGKIRMAPPFAAMSYTEIAGDVQFIRALFCWGAGPLRISGLRIGETPIANFDEVQIETRTGQPGDAPVTLYEGQVMEEQFGVDLRFEPPRDDYGEFIAGAPAIEQPVPRVTAADISAFAIIVHFPAGLVIFDDDGDARPVGVTLRIRHRLVGAPAWAATETFEIAGATSKPFFRQYRFAVATRGRYEVEVTRVSPPTTGWPAVYDDISYMSLQSIRPEYPINVPAGTLALTAVRVRATYQLNGALDALNGIPERICADWDSATGTWIVRPTQNPASLYRYALEHGSREPVPLGKIDLVQLADWHDYCVAKGLRYNRVHDFDAPHDETLRAICAAGRASPRFDGRKWGVVIDRPQTLVVDHIGPRNARAMRWQRTYPKTPHAFRVPFLDETADYQAAERIVPWPGHSGDITLTEELPLPGKTDPAEVFIEARRRMHEIMARPDRFSCVQDGAVRAVTRGDLVHGSFDMLDATQVHARVRHVADDQIVIDADVTMAAGVSYAVGYRIGMSANSLGESVVMPVETVPGITRTLIARGLNPMPAPGDLVQFGPVSTRVEAMIVRATEGGENLTTVLDLVAAAPEIDALTDAEVAPPWDGRVGEITPPATALPAAPRFTKVVSGNKTGAANRIVATLAPGTGSPATVGQYLVRHRLAGGGAFTTVPVPAGVASITLDGYASGAAVEMKASAVSTGGFEGPETNLITVTIGAGDPPVAGAIVSGSVALAAGLANVAIALTTGAATDEVSIFRVPAGGVLDRAVHKVRALPALANASFAHVDGDASRVNAVVNPALAVDANFTKGAGWTIAAGKASHAAGTASGLDQVLSLPAGKTWSLSFDVLDRTAGALTPQFTGGTTVSGPAVSTNGLAARQLTSLAGNNQLRLLADAAFDGSVDNLTLYETTGAAIAPGVWDYYFEPSNEDGIAGPMSGPHNATVR